MTGRAGAVWDDVLRRAGEGIHKPADANDTVRLMVRTNAESGVTGRRKVNVKAADEDLILHCAATDELLMSMNHSG